MNKLIGFLLLAASPVFAAEAVLIDVRPLPPQNYEAGGGFSIPVYVCFYRFPDGRIQAIQSPWSCAPSIRLRDN